VSDSGSDDFVGVVFEAARRAPLPEAAKNVRMPKAKLLVALCRELQRAAEEINRETFYLSCRDAGRVLGVAPDTASRWLIALQQAEIIFCVARGSKNSGMASQYRYLAD
jgi:hypothetical protein